MNQLGLKLSCLGVAVALAVPSVTFAAPVKDQGRALLRVEGHEETYGILSSPQHTVFDYTLAVTTLGEGVLSLFVRQPNHTGEGPDDPPRVSVIRFRLERTELAHLQERIRQAHLGQQQDCHSYVQFFAYASASEPPKQRLIWFGNARRHEFTAWQGSECGPAVTSLLHDLEGIAEAAYLLPTER